MDTEQVFEKGLLYHHYANTAYPLTPQSFRQYRITDEETIPTFLYSEWAKADEACIYVHIPFCSVRCKFCEYAVLPENDQVTEDLYVSLLLKEIEMYRPIFAGKKIVGFDIGGGTPTKLSVENLKLITKTVQKSFDFAKDVVFSIETTPVIAAREAEKINESFSMGYERISMGIQTISEKLLNELGREGTTHIYEEAVLNIRKAGFSQLNIDLMYGFLHQDNNDFEHTLRYAIKLDPEYITLYRNRYKGTKIENEASGVSLYKIICQYRLAYDLLTQNGYEANPGKNTFSKIKNNYGTSDYLTKRVINGVPYLGMGLGAQSFGVDYLAYNEGAQSKLLPKYRERIENKQFPIQDLYALPLDESISKMVSVAFYFGFIDFDAFYQRFNLSFEDHFKDEIAFVIENGYMEIYSGRLYLTSRGSDYINGIIPLFFSDRSKEELFVLINKKGDASNGEDSFLLAYSQDDFKRPSLTSDILLFAKEGDQYSILMIKRGEHPFMNAWAVPGGFVRPNETVETTAYRELREETGVTDVSLTQFKLFSNPNRDPRGWIISCAFTGIVEIPNLKTQFGEDAIDVNWFTLELIHKFENRSQLILTGKSCRLATVLKKTENGYEVIGNSDIAFDHAIMIASAFESIR